MNARQGFIGQPVKRKEDHRFLTGRGQYTDDITLAHQTHAVFVRSPYAHAKIGAIDTAAAMGSPGVLGIYTGADFRDVGGLPCGWLINNIDGTPMTEPKHPVLADGKALYVGDPVAVVIAETLDQARDAAALVDVAYDEQTPVVDTAAAAGAGSTVHDEAPDNVCYVWGCGDKAAVDEAIAASPHVSRLSFRNNRLIPNAIETRACNASYNPSDDSYTLYVGSQNPHVERLLMCAFVLGIPEHRMRVVAPDVGGGFGSKIFLYNEETALVWASKRIKRPIKWTADRSEAFLTDAHGRDHVTTVELGTDQDGTFRAMRVNTTANLGAYLSTFASCVPTIL
ncbi:MAG: molybdopterin cofactor-binding domain-containing protein, partial [Burkholderiaceae bacterium]